MALQSRYNPVQRRIANLLPRDDPAVGCGASGSAIHVESHPRDDRGLCDFGTCSHKAHGIGETGRCL
jgi:hypothetical protein